MNKQTDVPALSAAAVAGAISIFSSAGPYDPVNLIISLTMLLFIVVYVAPHKRKRYESLGFAGIVSFIAVPIFGVVIEQIMATGKDWGLQNPVSGNFDSNVDSWHVFYAWCVLVFVFWLLDQWVIQKVVAKKIIKRTCECDDCTKP